MSKNLKCLLVVVCALGLHSSAQAQGYRLLGITGLQGDTDQDALPDNTLFEISTEDGETTKLMQLTFIPDTHAIGYNPDDGLLYHTAGSESWTDDPGRVGGYRDHQYLETVNLDTGELTPIFNANPPESPDEFPPFGLSAPLPTFIEPQKIRLLDDPECEDAEVPGICPRERGENEYHGIRGLTWSKDEKLFYASDEHGIFKLTPQGEATFVGQPLEDPRDTKGIVLYEKDGNTTLLTGTKKNPNLWTVDPATGEQIDDPVELLVPPESENDFNFDGVLAMAQHPTNGVLFGVRRTDPDAGTPFARELITIDPSSGETHLVGDLGLHFASLAFVPVLGPDLRGDFNNDGIINVADVNLLVWEAAGGMNNTDFDLNADNVVDQTDIDIWIKDPEIANSWVGDANVDGEFTSGDLVNIFAAGKYNIDEDADWSAGDWTGDHRFDSADLVAAFSDGGYELGPRPQPGNAPAVPEPSSAMLLALGLLAVRFVRRRGSLR